jgi:hypothetical protein
VTAQLLESGVRACAERSSIKMYAKSGFRKLEF